MSASQTSSHGAVDDNVWQGYVSAVACLLLSLLLLMCILALAMVALGNSRKSAEQLETTSASTAPLPQPGDSTSDTQIAAPQSAAPEAATAAANAQWALQFPPNTVDIRPPDYAALAQKLAIAQAGAAAQWGWSLWTLANPQSHSAQRLAYVRLMSVRELLLKQGARADAIDIEIRPTAATATSTDETTVLVSRTRARNPTTLGATNGGP
jgi:hypothetical protein